MNTLNLDQLTPAAAPDFSDPLGLIHACHQRIRQHCELLEKAAHHLQQHGADMEVSKAMQQVYRYFNSAARHHHQDEEQDIFPLLVRTSLKLADVVNQLKQEHQHNDALWTQLAPLLTRPAAIDDPAAFRELAGRFCDSYRDHLRHEEEDLLPMAPHILSSEQLKKIGNAMQKRRR